MPRSRNYWRKKLENGSKDKDPSIALPTTLDPLTSYYQEIGLWLCASFIKAWAEIFTSHEWLAKYKRWEFYHYGDTGPDHKEPDFRIIAQTHRGQTYKLVVAEVKNWFAPQWLNVERTEEKLTKKFERFYGSEWTKLLVLTESVHFNDEARDFLAQWGFHIERVSELPGSHPENAGSYPKHTVKDSLYRVLEARSIEQMKRILEKYFL